MRRVSRALDRIVVNFDDSNLVANAGLLLVATLADRLDIEALVNATVRMAARWEVPCPDARCSRLYTPYPLASKRCMAGRDPLRFG